RVDSLAPTIWRESAIGRGRRRECSRTAAPGPSAPRNIARAAVARTKRGRRYRRADSGRSRRSSIGTDPRAAPRGLREAAAPARQRRLAAGARAREAAMLRVLFPGVTAGL